MKHFNAVRFFLGLMIAVGFILFSVISLFVDAGLTLRLAHLTVQLILFIPIALLITRLRAKACGLSFWPVFERRDDLPTDQVCTSDPENPDIMEKEELRHEVEELRRKLKKTKRALAMKNLDPPWEAFI